MTRTQAIKNSDVEVRLHEFWQDHDTYDASWPRNILHGLTEFMPFIFHFDAVGNGITLMYAESGVSLPKDFDWTSADEDLPSNELRKLPIFRLALALRAYAYYGLWLKVDEQHDSHGLQEFLEGVMNRGSDGGFFPLQWANDDELKQDIMAALARHKLDHDYGEGLTPEELAALSRVNRKTIMNLAAPSSGSGLRFNADGSIPLEDARRWLLARRDFRSSIKQQKQSLQQWSTAAGALAGVPVFVPATEDDIWFSPVISLVNARGSRARTRGTSANKMTYRVGDVEFDDYWQALDALHLMDVPRWRQLDAVGRAWEKVGTKWIRKTREELGQLPSSLPHDAPGKTGRRRDS